MKNIFPIVSIKLPTVVIVLLFTLCQISCKQKEEENHAEDNHEDEKPKTEVSLTEDQYKTVGIATALVEERNLKSIIKATGTTTVPPQNSANVATLMSGVVKDIYVLEGTFVKKGTVLATLKNLEITEIQQEYQSALASIEYLQLEFDRQKILTAQNITARKVFQEVKSKLKMEKVRAQAAKTKLETLHVSPNSKSGTIPIISPINGYVGEISIRKGGFAATGITLFEVVDNSQMHLDLDVYEKDLYSISIGQEVDFILTNQSNKSIKGKIFGINKSFSNSSKTVAVHAKIDPKDSKDLISGMYVSANIDIDRAKVKALPKEAVIRNGDNYYVFMKETENHTITKDEHNEVHFKLIEVIVGTTDMGYTEIKFVTSIPEDAEIVTKGAFYLQSALIGGGEHSH
ncbi:efflux RND transporter periplasmic adaptor subunit [Flavobacterium sp. TAB 87]|uniref:efflux RND transporter periplasmic adaptor subunit n=1 Tax=Flavobacterium sp. TAB 87 TaxID=1729581 RepID=UPI00076C4449|nr:efflux RND transporter periplasmic adaptor subunit [Flavobacterium sp. TAB 87]KVV15858.1 Nickel and cobalt resistance protein CnrB [Flavobacterium sp. TAB 87]